MVGFSCLLYKWFDNYCCLPSQNKPCTYIFARNYICKQALPVAAHCKSEPWSESRSQFVYSASYSRRLEGCKTITLPPLSLLPAGFKSNGRINQHLYYFPKHTPADTSCSCNCNEKLSVPSGKQTSLTAVNTRGCGAQATATIMQHTQCLVWGGFPASWTQVDERNAF